MRGTVAKILRKKIGYKPYAERKYYIRRQNDWRGYTAVNIGKRQEYLDAKRDYVNGV